eukprot:COSAG02_NODE_60335_length_271_cov_1.197674_1_plen_44_part_10
MVEQLHCTCGALATRPLPELLRATVQTTASESLPVVTVVAFAFD